MFKKFFKNVKEKVFKSKGTQKVVGLVMSAVALLSFGTMCFASEGSSNSTTVNTVSASDFKPIIDAFQSAITPQMIIGILAACAVVGIAFVAMWFGYGKIKSAFNRAFRKGKL